MTPCGYEISLWSCGNNLSVLGIVNTYTEWIPTMHCDLAVRNSKKVSGNRKHWEKAAYLPETCMGGWLATHIKICWEPFFLAPSQLKGCCPFSELAFPRVLVQSRSVPTQTTTSSTGNKCISNILILVPGKERGPAAGTEGGRGKQQGRKGVLRAVRTMWQCAPI